MTENKKNNKNLIWGLIILIILAVIFFGIYFYKNNSKILVKDNSNNTIVNGKNMERGMPAVDVDKLVGNIKTDYKNSASFKECIGMDMGIQSCLREEVNKKVRENDNPKYCDDLNNDGDRNSCKENYYSQKAVKTLDPGVCNNISSAKDSCLEKVYSAKAKKAGDESTCNSLKEDYAKQSCKRDVVREKAIKTNNPALCDKLVVVRTEGEGENATKVKDDMDVKMCKEEVKMEVDMRKQEEEMRKQEEKRVKQEGAADKVEN